MNYKVEFYILLACIHKKRSGMEEIMDNRVLLQEGSEQEDELTKEFERDSHHSLRLLLHIYKGNYTKLLVSALFFVIKHTPSWAMPIAIAAIVDAATTPQKYSEHAITVNVIIMVALIIQNIPTNYVYVKMYSLAIRNVEARLRESLIRKLQQLSISYHKSMQSGRLQSKIMRDVEAVENMSTQIFTSLLAILVNIIVAFSIVISKNVVVFLFFLVTIPIAVITIILFRNKIRERNHEFRREMEETSAKVVEMVDMIPFTRAYSVEETEINRLTTQINKVAVKGYRLDVIQSLFGSVSWVVFQLFQVLCLAFTGTLAYRGKISVGDIVLYQTYFTTIVNCISQIANLVPIFTKGMESLYSIGDILTVHDIEQNKGKEKIKELAGNYDFEDVSYSYEPGLRKVLNHFSLHVKQGETIAFVGASGAGKTTIMNLIIGFFKPTEGNFYIDGKNACGLDMQNYRRFMAVVPQESILFTDTLLNNITYGMDCVDQNKLERVLVQASIRELVDSLPDGLNTIISERGNNLSGGQKQRISIARALLREPDVILLDEATSALDSISEKKIQDALEILTKNRTTFIVAHRLSTIQNADRIVLLKDGRVEETGSFTELMEKKGEFYKMRILQS